MLYGYPRGCAEGAVAFPAWPTAAPQFRALGTSWHSRTAFGGTHRDCEFRYAFKATWHQEAFK
jgi:hypothetical protein